MRDCTLLVVVTLILLASCTGGSVTGGSTAIDDRVNRDCDWRLGSFILVVSLSYSDSADVFSGDGDGAPRRSYQRRVSDDDRANRRRFTSGGVEGRIDLTGSEFPSTVEFRLQVVELCPFEPIVAVGSQLPLGTVMSPQFEISVWFST